MAAACGGSDAKATAEKPAAAAASATFNDADVTFAQSMIPHHEQAVEMADIALDPKVGASAAVQDLAKRIKAAQAPEIATMTAWLKAWNKPVAMADSGGHNMATMDGMMSAADMTALGGAKGAAFDTQFFKMMIQHHQGAVKMAKVVQKDGKNPEVKALAGKIVTAQEGEIAEMNKALGK